MPAIASLTDFVRNQSDMIESLQKSGEPMYLTRNGKSSVVVMDAEAFDAAMSYRNRVNKLEMDAYAGILRGYEDYLIGNVMESDDAFEQIRREKGWS